MPNLSDLLTSLGKKGNISDDVMKNIMTNPALATIEVPDAFAQGLEANLMNEEQAKFNPNLKTHFNGLTHSTLRGILEPLANEIEDDDFKTQFMSNNNNFERLPMLIKKMKELEEAKVKAASSGKAKDVEEVTRQYNELLTLRKQEQDKFQNDIKSERQGFENKLTDMSLNAMLSSYKYSSSIPSDVASIVAREKLNAALKAKGAKMVYDNEGNALRLVNANDTSLPYRENHNDVSIQDFANRTFAEAKMLEVSAPATPPARPLTPPPNNPHGGLQRDVSANREYIEAMKAANGIQ
jgi:hypothetical protein